MENCTNCESLVKLLVERGLEFEYICDIKQTRIIGSKNRIMSAPIVDYQGRIMSAPQFIEVL